MPDDKRSMQATTKKAKIYTKVGDSGSTSLVDGSKVIKDNDQVAAYGELDELNSFVGLLRTKMGKKSPTLLQNVQNCLFIIGSRFACAQASVLGKLPALPAQALLDLETEIDKMENELAPLRSFILPGGIEAAAIAHICRTVCRRAERAAVRAFVAETLHPQERVYLNRLSDYFFVLARYCNHQEGVTDVIWISHET